MVALSPLARPRAPAPRQRGVGVEAVDRRDALSARSTSPPFSSVGSISSLRVSASVGRSSSRAASVQHRDRRLRARAVGDQLRLEPGQQRVGDRLRVRLLVGPSLSFALIRPPEEHAPVGLHQRPLRVDLGSNFFIRAS
jgi:hypothetical protein